MPRCRADIEALYRAVDTVRKHRRMTAREVAAEVGVPASTLTRIKDGEGLDVHAFVSFLSWLGDDAMRFVKQGGKTIAPPDPGDKVLVSRSDVMIAYSWAREALAELPQPLQPSGSQREPILEALERLHDEASGSPKMTECDLGAVQGMARLVGE